MGVIRTHVILRIPIIRLIVAAKKKTTPSRREWLPPTRPRTFSLYSVLVAFVNIVLTFLRYGISCPKSCVRLVTEQYIQAPKIWRIMPPGGEKTCTRSYHMQHRCHAKYYIYLVYISPWAYCQADFIGSGESAKNAERCMSVPTIISYVLW